MFKMKYLVIFLLIGCLVGLVSAEISEAGNDNGEDAWSASVAYDIDAGIISSSYVSATDYVDADGVADIGTTADDSVVDTESTTATATNVVADTVTASSSASEVGGSSSSTSIVATTEEEGTDATVTLAQDATVNANTDAATSNTVATVESDATAVVAAETGAFAADGASAGVAVAAAALDGTITVNQNANGVGMAGANQNVAASGDSIAIAAQAGADSGSGYSAGASTAAILGGNTGASLTVWQSAQADPNWAQDTASASQSLSTGTGSGLIVASTGADGGSTNYASADLLIYAPEGSSVVIPNSNQFASVDSSGSYASQDGLIWSAAGDIGVLASTSSVANGEATGAIAGMYGRIIDYGQTSNTQPWWDLTGSDQNTGMIGAGLEATYVQNSEGSIAATVAAATDGNLHSNQNAEINAAGEVTASQLGLVNTPDGSGIMATGVMNANWPNTYAFVAVGETGGIINPGSQSAATDGAGSWAWQNTAMVHNADSAFTYSQTGAMNRFGLEAGVGTSATGVTSLFDNSYVETDVANDQMYAGEVVSTNAVSTVTTAHGVSFFDEDEESETDHINADVEVFSDVFGDVDIVWWA